MDLEWSSLGEVVLVSIGTTVGVMVVFALGVRALSPQEGRPAALSRAVAGLCFAACAAAVVYGLYLIIPQFH